MSYDATQRDLLSYTSQISNNSPEGILISSLRNSGLRLGAIRRIFSARNFEVSEKYLKNLIHTINEQYKEECSSHLIVHDSDGSYFLRSWLL